jgi:putative hydrolase of the HAD superfamily
MQSPATKSDAAFDAILFDVGGVLLTNGWDHTERTAVYDHFGLSEGDRGEIEARHPAPYDLLERNALSLDEYLEQVIFFAPRDFSRHAFLATMLAQSQPFAGSAMGILQELAEDRPCLLGLLNNEGQLLHEHRMEAFGLAAMLDVQFSSCYLGLRKPEPKIFQRVRQMLGERRPRILFVDDRVANVEAAAAAGFTAIHFTGEHELRAQLAQLGAL